eukprot:1207772-Rhodomonas_salina.1
MTVREWFALRAFGKLLLCLAAKVQNEFKRIHFDGCSALAQGDTHYWKYVRSAIGASGYGPRLLC